jgi:hypothetical protein
MNKISEIEQFNDWVEYVPEFILEFKAMLTPIGVEFDFSPKSLDTVEEWILSRYGDTEEMLAASEGQVVNLLACYIGETMIRQRGGKWDIQLDPDYAFHGLPIIKLPNDDVECPLTLATAAADRRVGDFIRSIVCDE